MGSHARAHTFTRIHTVCLYRCVRKHVGAGLFGGDYCVVVKQKILKVCFVRGLMSHKS